MKKKLLAVAALMVAMNGFAQFDDDWEPAKKKPYEGVEYKVEMQLSASGDKTPLWLNANKYGLSSMDEFNGYLRGAVERPLKVDEPHKWGLGYGVDLAVPVNYSSNFVVQQAYVEGRWLHGVLTIGSKQQPMELKNNLLSSGSQTFGRNARPVPQVRLSLPEYWTIPYTRGWLHLKGHIAYGVMTDDNWQHDFTHRQSKYADNVRYHSKAGYIKLGSEERFIPWSFEAGLEMAALFGGTSHVPTADGDVIRKGETGLKGFWHAFIPGGDESGEETYFNVAGNQLGSWVARINYDADTWRFSFYADKYFEDHSSMLMLDYNGYGTGKEWNTKKKTKFLLYDPKDWMLGMELTYKYDRWVKGIVLEYLYSKYQSGPIYHDHNPGVSDHIGGIDEFYNHYIYTGWQHWGQVMGNPLYMSPVFNDDGKVMVKNNRFMAFHLGLNGNPTEQLSYRLLATYQDGLGTYLNPFHSRHHNFSMMAEANYAFTKKLDGWNLSGAYGMDLGGLYGHNYGFQLTITKRGLITK